MGRYDDRDLTGDDYDKSFMGDDDSRGGERRVFSGGSSRRKVCRFCTDSEMVLDYKNVRTVQSFMTEHGKIVPRRMSGNCAFHQRRIMEAVKRARHIALVGYTSLGGF